MKQKLLPSLLLLLLVAAILVASGCSAEQSKDNAETESALESLYQEYVRNKAQNEFFKIDPTLFDPDGLCDKKGDKYLVEVYLRFFGLDNWLGTTEVISYEYVKQRNDEYNQAFIEKYGLAKKDISNNCMGYIVVYLTEEQILQMSLDDYVICLRNFSGRQEAVPQE